MSNIYLPYNPEVKPEIVPPPSHQKFGNYGFYSKLAIEEADFALDCKEDALAITGFEDANRFKAKLVLPRYVSLKADVGTTRAARLSALNSVTGKRRLLHVQDFVIDVELCAKRALKRKPLLLKAFKLLFGQQADRERVNAYARRAPKAFDLMIALLGTEFRKCGVTGIHSYLYRPSRKRGGQ